MKLRHCFIYAVSLLMGLTLASQAKALSVSPAVMDFDLDPGAQKTGRINLYNDTNNPHTYSINTQRFKAGNEDGTPDILEVEDDNVTNDLKDWIQFPHDQKITLQPGESKPFDFNVEVPVNAEPGGHYAVVFFTISGDVEGESGVGLGAKLGVLVMVNVSGQITEGASIETFGIKNSVISHLPAEMFIRIKNSGTNYFRPKGNVTIKNFFGKEVVKIPANPKSAAVLPNGIRRIETWWLKDDTSINDNGFISGLNNEWKNFGLGRYTATAFVTYGTKNAELAPMTVSFWVFPWRLAIVFVLILVVLIGGIKLYNKFIVSSALKKQKS